MRFYENKEKYKEIIINWWTDLRSQTGDRAALRRCSNGLDTLLIPYTHRLISKLFQEGFQFFPDKIGPIAGILSHIEEDNPSTPFARSMARKEGEKPVINEIRFRKILQYSDILSEELFYQNMIRIVKNLKKKRIFQTFPFPFTLGIKKPEKTGRTIITEPQQAKTISTI